MICAVSMRILGIGPMGFCFGPGTRYRGVRALFTRKPSRVVGLNLWLVSFNIKTWVR